MRSGGKGEEGEVRSFKSHSCPLHWRSVVLLSEYSEDQPRALLQSELTLAEWPSFGQYTENFNCQQSVVEVPK